MHPSYKEIMNRNWESQLSKFSSSLFSWNNRALPSLYQRADVLTLFALSKVWFRGQVLPLPNKFALKFEQQISQFLWKGQRTNNVLSKDTVCLPREKGGLGVPHLQHRSKALFISQLIRTITGGPIWLEAH